MIVPKLDDNVVYDIELESITKDIYIDMKCTSCGYEELWLYAEEADFLLDDGDPEPPTWQCPKCYKESLLRKPD